MVDWPIFLLGLVASALVAAAVRAISREDAAAREVPSKPREPREPPGPAS